MELKLGNKESIRIITNQYSTTTENFIDVKALPDQMGIEITNWSNNVQYTELRLKNNQLALLVYRKKGDKKYTDLGYWEDAEVVYSINEVKH